MVVGTTNIDRRPCSILVTGFDWEEKDEVVAHFGTLGEVTETIEDEVSILSFSSAPIELIIHFFRLCSLSYASIKLVELLKV